MADLYRKSSLERMASPEQLDKVLRVTSPLSWLALLGITLIIIVTVVWSMIGTIPETITVKGIVSSVVGSNSVYTEDAGTVVSLRVRAGDIERMTYIMIDFEKISVMFQTPEFQEEANKCETMEDWNALLVRNGIEISFDETVELVSLIAQSKIKLDGGELSEDALDEVSGGVAGAAAAGLVLSGGPAVWACVGIGVVCVGAACLAGYTAYQALRWTHKHKCK